MQAVNCQKRGRFWRHLPVAGRMLSDRLFQGTLRPWLRAALANWQPIFAQGFSSLDHSSSAGASSAAPSTDFSANSEPSASRPGCLPEALNVESSSTAATAAAAATTADVAAADGIAALHPTSAGQPPPWLVASGASPVPTTMLLREFIHNSLYHPTRGFFNSPVPVVGTLSRPINYWEICNKQEYKVVVNQKYKELEVAFLTPAELFSPWYGAILARHMFEHRKHNLENESSPVNIMEIGGGQGTLAKDILDWIKEFKPDEYLRTTYTCIEISARLAAQQYQKVVVQGGHAGRFKLLRGSGLEAATWGGRDYQHTFVLLMEVLDNLPHDRVVRQNSSAPWQETIVFPQGTAAMETGPWVERLRPLQDPLITRCLNAVYAPPTLENKIDARFNRLLDFLLARDADKVSKEEIVFLPTASMALLDVIHDKRPNHSIIAGDFNILPHVKVPGKNAPLVQEKIGGQNIGHDTIFVPWGKADIFFPTDFEALTDLYAESAVHVWGEGEALGKVNAEHWPQGSVMKRYKEMFNTMTLLSFNPITDDFVNARFFMGDSLNRRPPNVPAPVVVRDKNLTPRGAQVIADAKAHLGIKPYIPPRKFLTAKEIKERRADPNVMYKVKIPGWNDQPKAAKAPLTEARAIAQAVNKAPRLPVKPQVGKLPKAGEKK